jgi:mannose-6-phosphate isomerase-like protein (cupin superfamily)
MQSVNLTIAKRSKKMPGTPLVIPAGGGRRLLVLGNEIESKLGSSDTGGMAFVFENATPPGDGVPPDVHTREDEMLRVIDGEYQIFLDGKTYKATAGAVFNFPRSVAHGFRNITDKPARALFITTPGANFEKFVGELSSLEPRVPTDMAKIAGVSSRYGLQSSRAKFAQDMEMSVGGARYIRAATEGKSKQVRSE